uniref:CD99 antigen-like protein 2 n=1 Tax=Lepisosteus oculatus TaxID=7918 RepID=W5NB34_LEPOC
MAKYTAWILVVTFYLLCLKGSAQDFDLADALDDKPTKPPTVKPNPKVPGGSSGEKTTTKAPKVTTTTTKAPPKPKPKQAASDDLNLADALDENNDIGGKDQNKNGERDNHVVYLSDKGVVPGSRGGTFTDEDLEDISKGGGYSPDKKPDRGRGSASSDDTNYADSTAETGTIAGIASALAMALIGAVSSYISYQQKKFCFSIQEGLNAEYVKGDTLEAVVAQEPQVQQTLLQSPSSEPPAQDSNKV